MKRCRREIPRLSEKANKILNGVLVVLVLVAIKVWHLAVIQHDKKLEEAKKPQRRVVVERSERATIYDRFNIPLATNKTQYNAAIAYGPIRELPRSKWKKNDLGKRVKYLFRKEYITRLAAKLAEELYLDPDWIEDQIHAKASVLGNVPCVIKENISESQYFRLKMLEKDWPGIHAEIAAKRCYPLGSIGGEVVGYIGPISRSEYESITREMGILRDALAAYEDGEQQQPEVEGYRSIEEISARLEELEKKAYHINDYVGKSGIEATCDEDLRGLCGKHIYLSDIRGNFLQKLPGSEEPISGTRLVLSLSAELQSFAQQLLAEYETESLSMVPAAIKRRALIPENQPWIKGGAILAMDPNTGEVYAMVSFPSFDPNDFIRCGSSSEEERNARVEKWLETEKYLASVWDMQTPYTRLQFDKIYYEEKLTLDWNNYLSFILPAQSPVRQLLEKKPTIADSIHLQQTLNELIGLFDTPLFSIQAPKIFDYVYDQDVAIGVTLTLQEKQVLECRYAEQKDTIELVKAKLEPYFSELPLNYEKLLLADLCRICVDTTLFTPALIDLFGKMTLCDYRLASAHFVSVKSAVLSIIKDVFLEHDFKKWREENFKQYLAERRKEEGLAHKKYARPYIDYLEKARKELFQQFWEEHQWEFICFFLSGKIEKIDSGLLPYVLALKNWMQELQAGAHQGLGWVDHYKHLCTTVSICDQNTLADFLKALRPYEQLNRSLLGKYKGLRGSKEKHLATAFYPTYGFGFVRSHVFRQATTIGSIFKLVPAYEALRQRYLLLKERGEALFDLNPLTIIDDKKYVRGKLEGWTVGYTLDGKPIPRFYRGGQLPRTEHSGVGKVDIVRALATSSNPYFSMLAGDVLEDPEDLCVAANLFGFGEKTGIDLPGEYAGRIPLDVVYDRTGLYSMAIGQHSLVGTPLQTAVMLSAIVNGGAVLKPQIIKERHSQDHTESVISATRWRVFMPPQIQSLLLSGLKQVVMGEKGTARMIRKQFSPPLINQVIGKTSTSEVIERMGLDGTNSHLKLKHVWFGVASYESNDFSKPELVVIVYLRFGEWGRNAAPLAIEIIQKWREIKKKYQQNSI